MVDWLSTFSSPCVMSCITLTRQPSGVVTPLNLLRKANLHQCATETLWIGRSTDLKILQVSRNKAK